MPLSKDLLDILVCPETKQDLILADQNLVDTLNQKIMSGTLKNRNGEIVNENISAALIRKDNKFLYLVREDIPIMLIDEAIPMDQLG